MRKAACRLCTGIALGFYAPDAGGGRLYYRCTACGYVFLPRSKIPSMRQARSRYLRHENGLESEGYRSYLESFLSRAVLPYHREGSTILDFGSGPEPSMARLIRERGLSCRIYDPIFAPGRAWKKGTYGLILLHEVAEHLSEPRAAILELASLLEPGGHLVLRTRFVPEDSDGFARWWYRMDCTHIGFFSPKSLRALFDASGLETLAIEPPDLAIARRRL